MFCFVGRLIHRMKETRCVWGLLKIMDVSKVVSLSWMIKWANYVIDWTIFTLVDNILIYFFGEISMVYIFSKRIRENVLISSEQPSYMRMAILFKTVIIVKQKNIFEKWWVILNRVYFPSLSRFYSIKADFITVFI